MKRTFLQKGIQFTLLFLFLIIFFCRAGISGNRFFELTDDGTWCWFSDPRALCYGPDGEWLLTGFVTQNGSVAALNMHIQTGIKTISVLYRELEVDDHNNPAFLQRSDGHFLAFYTRHHNRDLYVNRSLRPNDASDWGAVSFLQPNGRREVEKYGDDRYTYANPFCLSEENNRIYLFGRWTGFKPNVSWSDDGGETWSESRVVVCPQPFQWIDRPYVKYFSDGKEKIHLVFTDGHPRDEALNSVYYACYHHGAFFRSDGKQICTIDELPFEPREATLVYDAQTTGHRAWVYDLAADEQGNPVVAYARYPSEWDHIYHYTRFNGDEWIDTELVHSGRWFPQTPEGESEREPHYSGGMALDPNHPGRLFLSRQINGIFEIEMWSFSPDDATWQVTSLTNDSENDQVRPVVARSSVRNGRTLVLWNSVDQYVHYTRFRTGIRMWIEEP